MCNVLVLNNQIIRDHMIESASRDGSFSEKGFYLEEFRGRCLGLFLPQGLEAELPVLARVLDELLANTSRTVTVASPKALSGLGCEKLDAEIPRLEGRAWRQLRRDGRVGIAATSNAFETFLTVSRRLDLFKVVRLADVPGVRDDKGRVRSFIDGHGLRALLEGRRNPHPELLREIDRLLESGIENVNLCTVGGLHDELFTYSGSGTLFTRERYVLVRRLGVDDYDAAENLINRGVAEGYLAPRSDAAIDDLLAEGFGAFVSGQHLAGIGALHQFPGLCGEVSSLYTLTRFVGAGLGSELVGFALDRARGGGLQSVFACTMSPRVGAFFEGFGFTAESPESLPPEKWVDYDPERRQRVLCFKRAL